MSLETSRDNNTLHYFWVLPMLCAALAVPHFEGSDFQQFPWARLEDNNVLMEFLLLLAPSTWQQEILNACRDYLVVCDKAEQKDAAEDIAESLLRYFFTELDTQARFDIKNSKKAPQIQLSAIQRRVLRILVDNDMFWDDNGYPHLPLLGYGVPGYREQVRLHAR